MRFRKVVALISVAAMSLPGLAFAQPPSVTVTSPRELRRTAGDVPGHGEHHGRCGPARVLFRAEETTCPRSEYYVDMRRGADGNFWALLPVVAQGTNRLSYRVWARGKDGAERVTEVKAVKADAACAIPSWTPEEQAFAQNMAIGLTRDDQNVEPCGFLSNGVARVITADGRMIANQACAATLAAAAAAGTAAGVGAAAAGGTRRRDDRRCGNRRGHGCRRGRPPRPRPRRRSRRSRAVPGRRQGAGLSVAPVMSLHLPRMKGRRETAFLIYPVPVGLF